MKCHPGINRGQKCIYHVNGLPGMKVACVNSVCEIGQDDSTRAAPTFVPESQDENTHVKRKFYHPGTKFILGQNFSRLSCKLALTVQYIVADPGGGS